MAGLPVYPLSPDRHLFLRRRVGRAAPLGNLWSREDCLGKYSPPLSILNSAIKGNEMQRFRTCLACTAIFLSGAASAYTSPPFPRLAVAWVGGSHNYGDPAVQAQLAHGDIALIGAWPGWQTNFTASGTGIQPVLQNIKAINPNVLVFEYIKDNEIDGTIATNGPYSALFNKLDAMHWYLYPTGAGGSPVPSAWAGSTSINNTVFTPTDSNGDNWLSWFAKWAVSTLYAPNPSFDGFVVDNVFTHPRVNGDWQRNGTEVSSNSSQAAQWQRQGYASFFGTLHSLMPGKFQIGNIADWVQPNAVLTEYQGKLDGGSMEGMIGYTWSIETWGGWQTMMKGYRQAMAALGGPKLGIFEQVGEPTDYQSFRYGFTSTLMDDGYYAFQTNTNAGEGGSFPWFDEYSYQHKFGAAISSPPTTAWQHGVYRRDYENGIALVNPKGNGTQTVTLEANYTRITGTQAPSINSGQTVRTLTLQDRDGIILLRTQPLPSQPAAVPAPPAQVTVH